MNESKYPPPPPPPGYPPQENPPPGYPPQGYSPQGYPPQGYPPQGYPAQGYPAQSYPAQGYYQGPPVMPPPQYGAPPQKNQPGCLEGWDPMDRALFDIDYINKGVPTPTRENVEKCMTLYSHAREDTQHLHKERDKLLNLVLQQCVVAVSLMNAVAVILPSFL